jgi:hypothetical protein
VVGVLATARDVGEPAGVGAFTLTRTGSTTAPLVVAYSVGGTEGPGTDYAALPTTAVIPAGSSWVRVPVQAIDDSSLEGDENVGLELLPAATYVTSLSMRQELWLADDEVPAAAATAAQLRLSPLAVGATGTATLGGGAPHGVGWLLLAAAPAHLPVPPLGVVGIDPAQGGVFADTLLDSNGEGTLGVVVPATAALAGQRFWWQGLVLVPTPALLQFTGVASRTLLGPAPF